MKDELQLVMQDIIALLTSCGQESKAEWFQDRLSALQAADAAERNSIMRELSRIAAGMGSLADLPLKPSAGSDMTQQQADQKQWDLAAELGRLTR